jgi:chaperonin cofactor prefoldin
MTAQEQLDAIQELIAKHIGVTILHQKPAQAVMRLLKENEELHMRLHRLQQEIREQRDRLTELGDF